MQNLTPEKPEEKKEKKIFNEAVITGAVTKMVETKYQKDGEEKTLTNLSVLVKGRPDAEGNVRSNYYNVVVHDKNKESLNDIKTGTEVKLNGFITTEKNEHKEQRYVTDKIIATSISKNRDFVPKHGAYAQFSGLLTDDIVLEKKGENKYVQFALAQNMGTGDNAKTVFKNSVAYKDVAEQMGSLKKADFVKVEGILKPTSYQKGDLGAKYNVYDISVIRYQKLEKNISQDVKQNSDISQSVSCNKKEDPAAGLTQEDQGESPSKVKMKR